MPDRPGALAYSVEHQHIIGDRVADIAVEAQCHGRAADQLGSGDGVRAPRVVRGVPPARLVADVVC
jgi:hypothetical protein